MRHLILLVGTLQSCVFLEDGRDVSEFSGQTSGEIIRDGKPIHFVGYDTLGQTQSFGSGLVAAGFIEDGDESILVHLSLQYDKSQRFLLEHPDTVAVQRQFANDEYGFGLSYREVDESGEILYDHMHGMTEAQISGSFAFSDTDWSSFVLGDLHVTIDHPEHGYREIDLQVEWLGNKE